MPKKKSEEKTKILALRDRYCLGDRYLLAFYEGINRFSKVFVPSWYESLICIMRTVCKVPRLYFLSLNLN